MIFKAWGLLRFLILFNFLLSACASTNHAAKNTSISAFCENGRSKQQYVFQIASYGGVLKETPVVKVSNIIESQAKTTDFVIDNFVESLLVLYYAENPKTSDIELYTNYNLHRTITQGIKKGWPEALTHLVWVEDNLFALCENGICNGMSFPEKFDLKINFDYQKWTDDRCANFFAQDGYIDGLGCVGNKFGLLSYKKNSGFNGGWLVASNYISLPEGERKKLCLRLAKPEDCLEIKQNAKTGNPATDLQIHSKNIMDLIIKDGTKVSAKILGNWTISRITWDPSLICKYGRSNDDFYTD